jgi:RimJ/RimL family protein N-acetyltransferase
MYKYTDGLETDRLITRYLTLDDAPVWKPFYEHPEATLYVPNRGDLYGEDRARSVIEFQLARYAESRYGMQALIEKSSGEQVGMCGLLTQDLDGVKELEVGYHLLPKYWGNGFAIEAARMFKDYGFENDLAPTIVSVIHPENINSQKVAMRNGLTNTGVRVHFLDMDFEIHRITRDEWLAQRNP